MAETGEADTRDRAAVRLGPILLTPGITRLNALTFFYANIGFMVALATMNFIQPYIINDIIRVPADQQGSVTGALSVAHEIVAFLVLTYMGALSDRAGRRVLCALGFVVMAVALSLYPLATSVWQLTLFRIGFAAGLCTLQVMIIAAQHDYPQNSHRGRWNAMNSVIASIFFMGFIFLLTRTPGWLKAGGLDSVGISKTVFWSCAAFCVFSAFVVLRGYSDKRFVPKSERVNPVRNLINSIRHAAKNPRLGLAYTTAFVSRGDMVIISSFFSLWCVRYANDHGIPSEEALKLGGTIFVVTPLANIVWAPVWGYILDRVNRIYALVVALLFTALAFSLVSAVENPLNPWLMIPAMIFASTWETSVVMSGAALVGQEAPARIRGAVSGQYAVCGAVGVIAATSLGGFLFDTVAYGAPYFMMGMINLALCIYAFIVIRRRLHLPAAAASSA